MKRTRQIDLTSAVYEHAAALIGKTPVQVCRDAELLFQAHAEAFRVYDHAPVVVGIDIYNLEAEAYGATRDEPERFRETLFHLARGQIAFCREIIARGWAL